MPKYLKLPDISGYINAAELLKSLGTASAAGFLAFLVTFQGDVGHWLLSPAAVGLATTLIGMVADLFRRLPQGD